MALVSVDCLVVVKEMLNLKLPFNTSATDHLDKQDFRSEGQCLLFS